MTVAILCPVMSRPHQVARLIANVAATTKRYRLLFIAHEGDSAEIQALTSVRADFIIVPASRMSWACKINDGLKATTEPWVLAGADDLKFHPDWFERALRWADESTCVIGTNDICNPRVMTGQHSTHTLFRRDYVERFGTIDQPGLVMCEQYRHDFADDEAIATAKARGVYVHAFDSIVEHLHPMVGKSPDDATYRKGRQYSADGRRLFNRRKPLWTNEASVRLSMVERPERAVVVTATYGGYDPQLRAPVTQDIPCEFVCITDDANLEVAAPWRIIVCEPRFESPRMSAKVPKMVPDVGCDDVVWMDASHEITSPSFVREALASRHDGIAAFSHPRRTCVYAEIDALLGSENQGGLYFSRPLEEQRQAYQTEGYPENAGLFACGVLAWDLRHEKARELGNAWLEETERWSHQDQVEFPVVCRRLGISPGTFPVAQIDAKLSRGRKYLANRWFRIHPHIKPVISPHVSVLIPFSSEDADRKASYEHVRDRYAKWGWEVVTGTCEPPWSKGLALADAFRQASHDVLVIADADCLIDEASIRKAVDAVANGSAWAVPHRRTWRMNQNVTSRVLSGQPPRPQGAQQNAVLGGGCVVVSREAWETVGGVDPRFLNWGGEDISFGWALKTLCGPPKLFQGSLFHLWHEPMNPRKGSPESEALAGRYRRAIGDAETMRAIIEEARVSA